MNIDSPVRLLVSMGHIRVSNVSTIIISVSFVSYQKFNKNIATSVLATIHTTAKFIRYSIDIVKCV